MLLAVLGICLEMVITNRALKISPRPCVELVILAWIFQGSPGETRGIPEMQIWVEESISAYYGSQQCGMGHAINGISRPLPQIGYPRLAFAVFPHGYLAYDFITIA